MAKVLPATWPEVSPEALVEPGLPYYDSTVQSVVEGQHHFMCRYGIRHVGELFFEDATAPIPVAECQVTGANKTLVLEYVIVPRLAMGVAVILMGRVNSAAGVTVTCDCVEDATSSNSGALGAGPRYFRFSHAFGASRSRTETTLQISLTAAADANRFADLLQIFICDADLAAVP
ncbi:MAG: hypothetical protein WCS84_12580 [Nocardioides sp.]|jgi:hypothetical protein